MIGDRTVGEVARAFVHPQHYVALWNMMRRYSHPLSETMHYLTTKGQYPRHVELVLPGGKHRVETYSFHDMRTVNEIFCRLDYQADGHERVIVDFGSNVGISAVYFLTAAPDAQLYLFEPLPINIERLKRQLAGFEGRFELQEAAVGPEDGPVTFGTEPTGRYGGIGVSSAQPVTVPCVDSNRVLAEVLDRHGGIDILKIDIEGLEQTTISRIPGDMARRIRKIYAECSFDANPLPGTHEYSQRGSIARLVLRRG